MGLLRFKKDSDNTSEQLIAMADVIAKLKDENQQYKKLADRYWSQLEGLKNKIAEEQNIPVRDLYNGPLANRPISYRIELTDDYCNILADHERGLTVSFNREFDTSKDNYNWINEGDALITIKYDNRGKFNGCPTTVKCPVSGLFESVRNKLAENGDLLCRVKIIKQDLKDDTIAFLERECIKQSVLEKERKKMIERETLDELIAEGKVFNVITAKNGNRMTIPQDVASAVWNRDGGQCCSCGSKENLEFDHIIPLSKGGATTFRNLQLLCHTCNLKKSDNI